MPDLPRQRPDIAPGAGGVTAVPRPVVRSVLAGAIAYFAIVFAAGFVLGTLRVTLLVPWLGSELGAVAIELPFMLLISWAAASWVVSRFRPAAGGQGAVLGLLAFILLMLAEAGLATRLADQSLEQWAVSLREPPGLLGLIGQIAFAAMPWTVRQRR